MATTVFKKSAIIGGAAGSLDAVDGTGLLDGDFAFVTVGNLVYQYILDDDAGGAETSPTKITPDANAGNKRWILQWALPEVTATPAELNILDGITASTAELNILDGVTATAAELNILDGVTTTAAELNVLDGITATVTELNHTDGVTSAIQAQLDGKSPRLRYKQTYVAGPVNLTSVYANLASLSITKAEASSVLLVQVLANHDVSSSAYPPHQGEYKIYVDGVAQDNTRKTVMAGSYIFSGVGVYFRPVMLSLMEIIAGIGAGTRTIALYGKYTQTGGQAQDIQILVFEILNPVTL